MQDNDYNDLISRKALLAAYDAPHKGLPEGARKLIEEAPTVDAVPVVHGQWVNICETDHRLRECSVCHDWQIHYEKYIPKYCPNCGTKMDGGEDVDVGKKASAD